MKLYVPYLTSTLDITNFLNMHLFSYKDMVNIEESARFLIYDYFSAKFDSPYPGVMFNNANVYLKATATKFLNLNDTTFIAKAMFQAFWPMLRNFNYILSHCGTAEIQEKPTDCYFTMDGQANLMIYVPLGNNKNPIAIANAVPELSLLAAIKGGTA